MSEIQPSTPILTSTEPPASKDSLTVDTVSCQAVSLTHTNPTEDKNSQDTKWCPIPNVASQTLSRKFEVDLPNIEITSLDMTPHGCFVLAGCSNGMVLLFDLTSSSKHGTLVGHIRAKGMHTNLILTVKITEDSRFAFAGCLKGSMEMLAVDMGQIPMWRQHPSSATPSQKGKAKSHPGNSAGLRTLSHAPARVRTFNHLDPKLRGFGAVSRLHPQKSGETDEKYVLICGKGIKSVHVWLFTPASATTAPAVATPAAPSTSDQSAVKAIDSGADNNTEKVGGPVWTFLFDVATNGVTIEALGFRFWHDHAMSPEEFDLGRDVEASSVLSSMSTEQKAITGVSEGNAFDVVNDEKTEEKEETEESDTNKEGGATEGGVTATTMSSEILSTPPPPMLQMLSKSRGMCVRVWNLVALDRDRSEDKEDSDSDLVKLPYEDIPNSHDCRAFSDDGELAFGGLYNFSVLRLDAPKWANRESYEVPARCTEDDTGQRRRRLMREINEVIACHDGNHVLALCTDGGVLYYHYDDCNSTSSGGGDVGGFGNLIEFQSLTREVEVGPEYMTDDSWAIKRVGSCGTVVVIRACKGLESKDEEGGGAIVDISLLSDLAPEVLSPHQDASVSEELTTLNHATGFMPRNKGLCYHDSSQCKGVDDLVPTPPHVVAPSSGKPPSGRPRKKQKDKDKDKDTGRERDKNKLSVGSGSGSGSGSASVSGSGSGSGVSNTSPSTSTPRDKKKKVSSSSSSATPGSTFATPAETARGAPKQSSSSNSGNSKRARNGVMHISPQEHVNEQSLVGEEGRNGVGEKGIASNGSTVNKRLYAPTPNTKKKSVNKKHDDSGSPSPRGDGTTVTSTKTSERKSNRKRPLMLQVKYDGEDQCVDEHTKNGATLQVTALSSSTTSSCGERYSPYVYESRPLPLHIPHPGPAPTVKRVKIVPYPAPSTASSASTVTNSAAASTVVTSATTPTVSTSVLSGVAATSTLKADVQQPCLKPVAVLQQFQHSKENNWIPLTTSAFVAGIHLCDSTFLTKLGPNSRHTAEILLCEQDQLYQLFLIELLRGFENILTKEIKAQVSLVEMKSQNNVAILVCSHFLQTFFHRYQLLVSEMMQSQMIQIRCAVSKDKLLTQSPESAHFTATQPYANSCCLSNEKGADKQWSFVHCRMYTVAEGILESVEKMMCVV